jgi:hypothetical protein
MDELILRLQSGTTAPEWDLLAVPQPAPTSEPADALTSLMDDELIGEYPAYFSETTTAPFAPLSMTSEHVDEDAWILGFRNRDGSSDYYDMATGTWTFGFRNRDGSNDLFSLGSGARAMGFRNRDGSSDYYHLGTGGWTYGFRNRDGSFDYLDSRSGTWSYGFRNRDGSQDFYLPKYGWPHYRK